jgi:hypothetical protein
VPTLDKSHPEAGFIEVEPLVIGVVDLVFVVIALACLLVVGAGWVFFWVVAQVFSGISVFGTHPFGFIAGLLEDATKGLANILVARVTAFAHFIWSIVSVVWRFLYVTVDVITGITNNVFHLHQVDQSGLAELRAKEQSDVDTIDRLVAAYVDALNTQERTDAAQIRGTMTNDYNAVNHRIDVEINDRVQGDSASVTKAEAFSHAENTIAIQNAEQLYNRSVTDNATLRNTLEGEIHNAVLNLEGLSARNLATAEAYAQGLVGSGAPASLIAAVTTLQSQVSKIATETAECLDPLCDTVTPQAKRLGNLGKWLSDLESLGIEALLIALAAECLTNPGAVAHDISTVTHDVGDVVMTGFRDLVGV